MVTAGHVIHRADVGTLMRFSFTETVEVLVEPIVVAKHDCRRLAANVLFGQMAEVVT